MPVIRRVPQDYVTVAAAHSAADAGDLLYITGQLTEIVTLTKAVHLIGAGGLDVAVDNVSTSYGFNLNSGSTGLVGVINYNLSELEAAKVPFLLLENLLLQQTSSNSNTEVVRLDGVAPESGLVINRCALIHTLNNSGANSIEVATSGWTLTADRCLLQRTHTSAPLATYTGALLSGHLIKCQISPELKTTDLAQNWETKDVVTTATTGYGPTGDGIALRMDDLDYETYRIYGTVTDIPDFVNPEDFEIRLYPEKTAQGNDVGFYPLEIKPLTLVETVGDKWSGSWEFNYLLPTRRYGILINPPDGMQGHWLRWYNPAVE